MRFDLPHKLYKIYAALVSRYYAYKDCNEPEPPPMPCQICGKSGHEERYYPNTWKMGFSLPSTKI